MKILILSLLTFSLLSNAWAESQWTTVKPASRHIKITGFSRAQAKMPLISEVSGKVVKVYADIGEPIPKSGLFACLDDTFVNIDIQREQNEISRHYVDIKFYQKEVDRYQKLVKKQSSAVSVLDNQRRKLDESKKSASIASIRKKRLQELKKRHCIKAPPGWLVIDRQVEPGQWINKGEVLGHAGNYTQLTIPLTLSLQELQALKQNQDKLQLYFPDVKVKVPARIENISPAFDEKTRKIRVDLIIDKFPANVRGGMRCELILDIPDSKHHAWLIDRNALEERFEEYWLERKDGKRIRVKLLGSPTDKYVKISAAEIKPGDQFKLVTIQPE